MTIESIRVWRDLVSAGPSTLKIIDPSALKNVAPRNAQLFLFVRVLVDARIEPDMQEGDSERAEALTHIGPFSSL